MSMRMADQTAVADRVRAELTPVTLRNCKVLNKAADTSAPFRTIPQNVAGSLTGHDHAHATHNG
jgi:hypothetical protein